MFGYNLEVERFPVDELFETRKIQTGYVRISSLDLTAADIIQNEKEIGGLN